MTASNGAARGRRPHKSVPRTGFEVPRIWTRPLRPLTPETSLGFEVIEFAEKFLHLVLYPWQKWLLIHGLELLADGETYRFRNIVVLVGRQNGKSTLAAVLSAWWLFVESDRNPERLPPFQFKVLGTAQNLDTARDVWDRVNLWCNPTADPTADEIVIPVLQDRTAKISFTNGKERTTLLNRAHYEIKAVNRKGGRGKAAARILMDEMREQTTWAAWDSVSQTKKAIWNSQLWGFSNAGDVHSVVLLQQRAAALADIEDFAKYVEAGILTAEEYANGHDVSLALFEWSAPDDCKIDDPDAVLQANPSCGWGAATLESLLADRKGMTEASYRTEVLCQWVTSTVESFIPPEWWTATEIAVADVAIPPGARTVWGLAVSADRKRAWVSAATTLVDGRTLVTIRARRAGIMWVTGYLRDLAASSGHREVALRSRGAPEMEFLEPLAEAGLTVIPIDGSHIGVATGRFKDHARDHTIAHPPQPGVDLAIPGAIVKRYAENLAWDIWGSLPVDAACLVAETVAAFALETISPAVPAEIPPPPPAAALVEEGSSEVLADLATVAF